MRVKYIGDHAREVAPAYHPGFDVEPGQVVDVPDELAASLLEQTDWWMLAPASKKKDGE